MFDSLYNIVCVKGEFMYVSGWCVKGKVMYAGKVDGRQREL